MLLKHFLFKILLKYKKIRIACLPLVFWGVSRKKVRPKKTKFKRQNYKKNKKNEKNHICTLQQYSLSWQTGRNQVKATISEP